MYMGCVVSGPRDIVAMAASIVAVGRGNPIVSKRNVPNDMKSPMCVNCNGRKDRFFISVPDSDRVKKMLAETNAIQYFLTI